MIIGIGSYARVGKDTAALALTKEFGFERVAFADLLRDLAWGADPLVTTNVQAVNIATGAGRLQHVVRGHGTWDEAKDTYPEVRRFLQNLGVAARDVFGDDFWIRALFNSSRARNVTNLVIPDVRFLNEIDEIRERDGKLIRIDRPGYTSIDPRSEGELDDFDGWDAVINNNGTIHELEQDVVAIVRGWLNDES